MKSLDEYLRQAEQAHGHLCAGQVLGVRLAMLGLAKLGIDDPGGKDRKRLVTFVEIDRCATDAVAVVTGCRLGKRALKFRDWGKVAATFVDVSTNKAVRVAAKESSKTLARAGTPGHRRPTREEDVHESQSAGWACTDPQSGRSALGELLPHHGPGPLLPFCSLTSRAWLSNPKDGKSR